MSRTRSRAVPGLAAAVALVATALAVAGPADAAHRRPHRPAPLVVEARTISESLVDLGEPGLSPGDQQVLTEDLYRDGRRVGEDHIVCSVVRVGPAGFTAQCVSTA